MRTRLKRWVWRRLFNRQLSSKGYSVVAIEPDPHAFELATREPSPGVAVFNCGIAEFECDEKFDDIVVHDVMERIENDYEALKLIKKHLSEGGLLVGSVPALLVLFGSHDEQLGHFRRYTRKTLRNLLVSEFRKINTRYFGFLGLPVVAYYSRYKKVSYPSFGNSRCSFKKSLAVLVCKFESWVVPPIGVSLLFVVENS